MESTYHDDAFNPNDYQDAGTTILPQPGEYTVRATNVAANRLKDGKPVLTNDIYPTMVLNRIEIVDPQEESGAFAVFQDVRTKPFERKASGGRKVKASQLVDLIRAVDVDMTGDVFPSLAEGVDQETVEQARDIAKQVLDSGAVFNVKLGRKAVDSENAKAQLEGVPADDYETRRKVWGENTYYTKAFKRPDGTYNTAVATKAGKTIQGKLVIDTFVPSTGRGPTGPFKR